MRLYAATTNPGKLRDFVHAAEGRLVDVQPVEIKPLAGLRDIPVPAEDEPTFEGNARLKAIYYSRYAPGELVIADDSGLEVACLWDGPGVRSARLAEDQAQVQNYPAMPASTLDERNNISLLRALDGVPEHCRRARYRCVLAVARNAQVLATAEGTVEGQILTAYRGEGGFGYDPLFLLPDYGRTMAEVELEIRLNVSHRGRALRNLLGLVPGISG
jgi:XTP/dITP diphosphohydrolase